MGNYLSIFIIILILLGGCSQTSDKTPNSQLPNPASVYCEEQGGSVEIRTSEDGSQSGYCVFENSECEEWDFYRGECEK